MATMSEFLHNPWLALLFLAISAPLLLDACAKAPGIRPNAAGGMDLEEKLAPVDPVASDSHVSRNMPVTRKGLRKDALILVAPISVRASLKGISGSLMLEGLATPMFNIGDGIQMDLFLSRAGERHLIGNRFFDAGRRAEDREWIPIAFPMDVGKEDQLEIEISAGPQGDLVADWLAFSSLRLMQRKVAP
jgi:hypothetical protein